MECLDENTLAELAEGVLSQQELARLEPHLDSCPRCRLLLATAARETPAPITSAVDLSTDNNEVGDEPPGRYVLGEELGQTRHAKVLVAYDLALGREVAFKQLVAANASVAHDAPRFLREARITSQLMHPNIVPVHEIGRRADGSLYYTMQLVRGRTLAVALALCTSLQERLALLGHFQGLCHAIAFAHDRGVVHRDIKPHNVMIGEFGETVVLDWGLARIRHATHDASEPPLAIAALPNDLPNADATADGTAIGTPAYMSPEQARGQVRDVDERSDVFGLAAVLYEILTGRAPYHGRDHQTVLKAEPCAQVLPVHALCPEAPAELAAIAQKGLAYAPPDRYGSAAELAHEIERYLTGGQVRSYAYSSWELLTRFVAKNRALTAALVAVAVVVVAALAAVAVAWKGQADALRDETAQRLRAEYQEAVAKQQGGAALLEGARAAWLSGDPLEARAKLRSAVALSQSVAARALWWQVRGKPLLWMHNLAADVHALDYSPDGAALAIVSFGGRLDILDAETHALKQSMQLAAPMLDAVAYAPSGERVAVTGRQDRTVVVELLTQTVRPIAPSSFEFRRAVSAHHREVAALGAGDGSVCVLDAVSGALLRCFAPHREPTTGLVFSADDRQIITVSADHRIAVSDVETGALVVRWEGGASPLEAVAVSPGGEWVATGAQDGSLRIWELPSGRFVRQIAAHAGRLLTLAFSPDGQIVASGGGAIIACSCGLWPRVSLSPRSTSLGRRCAPLSSTPKARAWRRRASISTCGYGRCRRRRNHRRRRSPRFRRWGSP